MLKRKIVAILLLIGLGALGGVPAIGGSSPSTAQAAPAQEAWQREFDEVCSKTQDALTFSQEQLTTLIQRCDALLPQIEKLDETQKKVFTGRLRMCRGLYVYVLDSKKNEKK
jgi:TolA-binding protein